MRRGRSNPWALAGLVLSAVVGCGARSLDPGNGSQTGGAGGPPEDALVAALRDLGGADSLLIVGTNAGWVPRKPYGEIRTFREDPETLVEAAAVVGMPVCSVEFNALAIDSINGDAMSLTYAAASDACGNENLGDMIDRLNALKTASTVVVVAANAAVTDRTTNGGINFFYDADITRLTHAARKLYVPVCVVSPESLALPTPPQGQTPGLSVDEALAACGL